MITKPILCNENGKFYNRKTSICDNFIAISDTSDDEIVISGIDVAYSHNYGIAFWILMEEHTDIKKSIDIIWEYHMQISLLYDDDIVQFDKPPQRYEIIRKHPNVIVL